MVQINYSFFGLLGALFFLPMLVFPVQQQHKTTETEIKNIVFDLTGVLCAKAGMGQRTVNHQMVKLVKQLKHAGKRVFVLSNTPKGVVEKLLAKHDFFGDFDGIMFSYQVQVKKPNQQIYTLFFEKFNLKPENCFFIDDEAPNVCAAIKCGMHSVLFCGYDGLLKELKTHKIL